MWLGNQETPTFSWEWYTQEDVDVFKKLQGNGKVKVDYEKKTTAG